MKPYFESEKSKLFLGDCLNVMQQFPENSFDSIVTDPPYGLKFMGKKWDYDVPSVEIWKECLRVLKPGGFVLSFAGTRTQHRMAVNIEDAGFEIRDMIAWVYGSGFPKSLNIGKAIDKIQGNEREDLGVDEFRAKRIPNGRNIKENQNWNYGSDNRQGCDFRVTKGTSEWEGWGTALKPAMECISVCRKPLSKKTVAQNVLKYGTGGINIDGSRVEMDDDDFAGYKEKRLSFEGQKNKKAKGFMTSPFLNKINPQGRFPANLCHDGSEEVLALFPESKSTGGSGAKSKEFKGKEIFPMWHTATGGLGDSGSAARFFYCAKSSKAERGKDNTHPTVKPIALMQYLVKLVTPKGGVCLDPFGGSGSTGLACEKLGFKCVLIEKELEAVEIAAKRIKQETQQLKLF